MSRKQRLHVLSPEGRIPFLRGMLTHSLLKRGLGFDEAYSVANLVRDRLAEEEEVTADKLQEVLHKVVAKELGQSALEKLLDADAKAHENDPPLVLHDGNAVPFSRGLLSQRLAATGLDPRQAYETAQEVWNRLNAIPTRPIDWRVHDELVREIVEERHGKGVLRRYDAMLQIEDRNRPIIVLIGGATGCGKSTLATEIAYRLGIRKIASTDLIREIMRRLLSKEILPSIHSSSYAYRATTALTDPVIEGYREQVMRVEVGIEASIRRAVVESFHLIVEGVHVLPPMSAAMRFGDRATVIPVIIATFDPKTLMGRFLQRKKTTRSRRTEQAIASIDDILKIQEHILDLADQHDVPILENNNFDEAASDLLRMITDAIHRVRKKEERGS